MATARKPTKKVKDAILFLGEKEQKQLEVDLGMLEKVWSRGVLNTFCDEGR